MSLDRNLDLLEGSPQMIPTSAKYSFLQFPYSITKSQKVYVLASMGKNSFKEFFSGQIYS
jgi:hypothetical protein